jgi:putative ABC transport system substrate-binding protein
MVVRPMRSTMTRLITIVVLLLLTTPLAVEAQQQPGVVRRIGVLMYQSRADEFVPLFAAFRQGLREAGYVEGQNIAIEWQDARGSHARLPALAADLVRLKVEAIFAVGPQALKEAKSATGALPIVAIDLESDPVEAGYVANLARPGGNVTGVFLDLPELMGKWLELVRDVTPVSSVAALWDPTTATPQLKAIKATAQSMALRLEVFQIREPTDFDTTFGTAKSARVNAIVVLSSPLMLVSSRRIADFARTNRLPAISMFRAFPLAGGLMSYGPAFPDAWQRVGIQVSKILGGMKPAELPVERPSRFELVINLKTARALDLTLPPTLLLQADEVIQ